VGTQVELASKKLKAGDYHEALRQAERALALDPKSAAALQVKKQAQNALDSLGKAVAEVRAAADAEKARDALWKVMQLDPDNAVVQEVASGHEAQFRSQAEQARGIAREARAAAERARVAAPEGVSLLGDGEASFKTARYVTAARLFLKARDAFQRATQPSD
jgi:tetratricopeptide (TPR) repeat protein